MSQYVVVVIKQRRRQKTEGTDDVLGSHFHANEGRMRYTYRFSR